ncbi:DUF6480 family protein [Streptomyces sp. 900105755]
MQPSHPEPPELRKGWGPMPLLVTMTVVPLVVIGLIAMAVARIAWRRRPASLDRGHLRRLPDYRLQHSR